MAEEVSEADFQQATEIQKLEDCVRELLSICAA